MPALPRAQGSTIVDPSFTWICATGFVQNEEKNRQGMTRNGYDVIVGCVKNIAKGRYWLTPKFLHRFKILSAICWIQLRSGLFFMNNLPR